MSDYLKAIYSLTRLKYKIFKNTIFKSENWSKIIAIILFLFVFLNTLQSSAFIVQYVKDNFEKNSELFHSLFEIILLIIFITNIIGTLTLSGSDYSRNFLRTLLLYPINFNRIIFYEIINGVVDIISLLYLPLYLGAIFLSGNNYSLINYLVVFIILLFFLLTISNIIYLFRNIIGLLSFTKHAKKITWVFSLMAGFSLVMVLKYLPDFLADKHNLILVSKYIEIFPTSVFATVLLESSTNFFSCFIIAISYFSIFNIILFLLNIYSAKMFKIKSYGKIYQKFSNKKSILTKLFINVAVNPFSKKDVAYTLRSIRTAPSHIMILFFLVIIPVTSLNDLVQYNQNITDQFSLSFLFISMIVLSFTANVFSFESNSIINYFYRPINYSAILKGKMFISNFYFLILSLGNLIIMLISKTKLLDAIFFEIAFLFSYLFLLLVSFPLSIFFPKKVSFTAMSGFLTSLISLFVFSIAAIIIWLMFYGYFQFYVVSVNKILALTCMFLSIIFFLYFKEKILSTIGKLLLIRKEKIIQVFK